MFASRFFISRCLWVFFMVPVSIVEIQAAAYVSSQINLGHLEGTFKEDLTSENSGTRFKFSFPDNSPLLSYAWKNARPGTTRKTEPFGFCLASIGSLLPSPLHLIFSPIQQHVLIIVVLLFISSVALIILMLMHGRLRSVKKQLDLELRERKEAELEASQRNEELNQFFNAALDLLCIADTTGYFRRVNQAWERTLGYSQADLLAKPFLDLVHPDDRESTLAALKELDAQKEVLNFINRYQRKDGTYCWVEWRSFPVGQRIYAAARDITPHIQTEEKLRESEQRYRKLFDEAIDGICLADEESGIILDCNKTMAEREVHSTGRVSNSLQGWHPKRNRVPLLHHARPGDLSFPRYYPPKAG
jgi:PAS domain S-box-containing protein